MAAKTCSTVAGISRDVLNEVIVKAAVRAALVYCVKSASAIVVLSCDRRNEGGLGQSRWRVSPVNYEGQLKNAKQRGRGTGSKARTASA